MVKHLSKVAGEEAAVPGRQDDPMWDCLAEFICPVTCEGQQPRRQLALTLLGGDGHPDFPLVCQRIAQALMGTQWVDLHNCWPT